MKATRAYSVFVTDLNSKGLSVVIFSNIVPISPTRVENKGRETFPPMTANDCWILPTS